MVRAKLTLISVTELSNTDVKTLKFSCVYSPEVPADIAFCKATPFGEATLAISNPKALEQFELGKSYFVDFTPAPPPPVRPEY